MRTINATNSNYLTTITNYSVYYAMHNTPCSIAGPWCGRGRAKDRRRTSRRFLVGPADRAPRSTCLTSCSCCSRAYYCFGSCERMPDISERVRADTCTRRTVVDRIENATVIWCVCASAWSKGRIRSTAVSVKGGGLSPLFLNISFTLLMSF